MTLLPVQLGVSVLALGAIIGIDRHPSPRPERVAAHAWLGVLNPGIAYALGLIGLTQISASMSVLLWATEPLLILGLAVWILKERVPTRLAVAAAVAVGGVILVSFEAGAGGRLVGIVFTLLGVLACSIYTIIAKQIFRDGSALRGLLVQQIAALAFALALLAIVTVVAGTSSIAQPSAAAWLSAVGSGLLYYGAGFWFYLTGLRHIPAATAASFLNLIPVFGIGAGFLFLGEAFSGEEWLGAILIVGAVAVVVRGQPALAAPASMRQSEISRPNR